MTAVKDINTLTVGDIVVWYNGPLTFKEKVVKMKDGRLAVRGIGSSLIPLTSLRLDLFKESNTNMENTESILEAARKALGAPLNENTIDIVKKVATLNIGDDTNFGRVLEIGVNSITFKAKDLPKTKITFNQRKIGSSDFVLSALTKLNEARGYKSLTPAVLIDELQSIIDLPDNKLTDVTNISFRVSREEIHKRYPEIYKLLEKMYDAVMKPNGAKETKMIAQKAIEIVRSKYPNTDKYQRMAPIKEKLESTSEETLEEKSLEDEIAAINKKTTQSLATYVVNNYHGKNSYRTVGNGYKKYFKAVLDVLGKRKFDLSSLKGRLAGVGVKYTPTSFDHYLEYKESFCPGHEIKEKYAISAGYKEAVASLMKCERYFSPNSNLAKSIIAEFGEGYKKDFAEMEKYLGKVISLWEGIEMEIAIEE
jgi:hypothetical protein